MRGAARARRRRGGLVLGYDIGAAVVGAVLLHGVVVGRVVLGLFFLVVRVAEVAVRRRRVARCLLHDCCAGLAVCGERLLLRLRCESGDCCEFLQRRIRSARSISSP